MRAKSERLDDRKRLTCSSTKDTMEVVLLPTMGPLFGAARCRCCCWSGTHRWKLGTGSRCRDVGVDGQAAAAPAGWPKGP
jgi:hypothetical protein